MNNKQKILKKLNNIQKSVMKDIRKKLVKLLKNDNCTPKISKIAKKLNEPSSTIHYNIKKLEEKAIKAYKAVFNYKEIGEGFCAYVLINLAPDEYGNPEKIGKSLAKHKEVESVDICTGDWEIIAKVRAKDQDEYYQFAKNVISRKGITNIKTLMSMKQLKTEFVPL